MQLRAIPIRRASMRSMLWWGCDRELVLFSGLICACMFFAQSVPVAGLAIALWVASVFMLRLMAKADPKMRLVFQRSRRYARYYPARSTPFRVNTRSQVANYKEAKGK